MLDRGNAPPTEIKGNNHTKQPGLVENRTMILSPFNWLNHKSQDKFQATVLFAKCRHIKQNILWCYLPTEHLFFFLFDKVNKCCKEMTFFLWLRNSGFLEHYEITRNAESPGRWLNWWRCRNRQNTCFLSWLKFLINIKPVIRSFLISVNTSTLHWTPCESAWKGGLKNLYLKCDHIQTGKCRGHKNRWPDVLELFVAIGRSKI